MPNPFAHIELSTDDLKKAKKFYQAVFAWKLSDMPGVNYTMIDVGGGTGGGMQKQPMSGAPTAWLPYVQVDSVKATLAKAKKSGARVALDYMEIGGSMGALGVFSDPQGAMIGVWEQGAPAPASGDGKTAAARKKATKKAPAKKASAKASAKKAPAKKAPAKKATGKKRSAKR